MKKSIAIIIVFLPAFLFAQKKGLIHNIKEHSYFKLSPTVLFPVDGNITPAAFGTAGVRVNRYIALGLSGGYFKFRDSAKAVIPIGIDVTITDLNSRKITPVFVGQLFFPVYKSNWITEEQIPSPYGMGFIRNDYTTRGIIQFQLGAGMAVPVMKKNKLLITGHYSQFNTKTRDFIYAHTPWSARGHYWDDHSATNQLSMWAFTVSWVF